MSVLPELDFLMRDSKGQYHTLAFWKCACQSECIRSYWQLVCERCGACQRADSYAPVADVFTDPNVDKVLLGQVQIALLQDATQIIQVALEQAANRLDSAVIARLEMLEAYLVGVPQK